MDPWLSTEPPPGPAKLYLPAMKLASVMLSVEATRPPTFTWAVGPNMTPFGLIRKTLPLAVRVPKMLDGSEPVTRFSATALPFGCTNWTVSPLAMLKVCQSSTAFWLDWLTVSASGPADMAAAPTATEPPVGRACAADANASVLTAANRAVRARPARRWLGAEGQSVVRGAGVMVSNPAVTVGAVFADADIRKACRAAPRSGWTREGPARPPRYRGCGHRRP